MTIDQTFVDNLYNPKMSGITILKNALDSNKIQQINSFIKINNHSFEEKKEKYIKNNQLVSLLYRGPFNMSILDDTIFKYIIDTYKDIRYQIAAYSDYSFEQGTSIEIKLIHYPISDLGVGVHKDLSSNLNIVVFFNLDGYTSVKTYDNKEGKNSIDHFVNTGDISIMRAPRFKEIMDIRPYHGVEEVIQPRTVLVIREINEELEEITNKDNWRGF